MTQDVWHLRRTKSWWDGAVITWCGQRFEGGTYETDLLWIGARPKCPACKDAKKRAK